MKSFMYLTRFCMATLLTMFSIGVIASLVDKPTPKSKMFNAEALFAGEMRVTSYRSVPWQTKPKGYQWTASGERCNVHGCAVSQDLLQKNGGFLKFGDVLYVQDIGYLHINDTMNKRHKKRLDVWVETYNDEKKFDQKFARRLLKVWLMAKEIKEN